MQRSQLGTIMLGELLGGQRRTDNGGRTTDGPKAAEPRILEVTFDAARGAGYAYDSMTNPYPTWYYAFVDLNANRRLDPGEAFGVDPGNPSEPGGGPSCKSENYRGAITINRKLP